MKRRVRKNSKLLSAGPEIQDELAPEYDFSKVKLVGRGIYAERYWPQQHQWLRENLETLYRVLGPRVKQLDTSKAIVSTSQPI